MNNQRSGTENVPYISSIGYACQLVNERLDGIQEY